MIDDLHYESKRQREKHLSEMEAKEIAISKLESETNQMRGLLEEMRGFVE